MFFLFALCVYAATPEQWRDRSIYQIVTDRFERSDGNASYPCDTSARTWCGGTWAGIQRRLDYIEGMGFDAIWISPIYKNIDFPTLYGDAYAGYYIQDYTQLNPRMGTEDDLTMLISDLHRRGMYIMVDNVPNHMAGHPITATTTLAQLNLTGYVPFNQPEDFHPVCLIDYHNATSITDCWMGDNALPLYDLNTDNPDVDRQLREIVHATTKKYDIDGIRIDAVKHIKKSFWRPYNDAAGVYALGEVFSGDGSIVCGFQPDLDGLMNFGVWQALQYAFNSTSSTVTPLADMIHTVNTDCVDSTLLGSFFENQDTQRWRSMTSNTNLVMNALVFTFMGDGIPIMYYGFEQDFSGSNVEDGNREALWSSGFKIGETYELVKNLNVLRKSMQSQYFTTKQSVVASTDRWLAVRKHDVLTITNNYGSGKTDINFKSPFPMNTQLKEFFTGEELVTTEQFDTTITGAPQIWVVTSTPTFTPVSSSSRLVPSILFLVFVLAL